MNAVAPLGTSIYLGSQTMKFFSVRSPRSVPLMIVVAAAMVLIGSSSMWVIELRRTACLGLCPEYTIKVWSNGLIQYHGNFALVTGDRVDYIGPFQAQQLLSRLLIFGFLIFEDTYSQGNIDFAGSTTCVRASWSQKCVKVTFSIQPIPDPPPGLQLLNRSIDALTGSGRWTGTLEQMKEKYLHPQ
jgi:hypothetical protein